MAPCAPLALTLALAGAALFSVVAAVSVSPRLQTSIGVAPRSGWENDDDGPAAAAAAARGPAAATVRAVLEVVVPTAPAVVCVAGATGCAASAVSSTTRSPPPVLVGGRDDAQHKVFFVDEDSDEELAKALAPKKTKKTPDVPIVMSYAGWKGRTQDDIPIAPRRNTIYTDYDMEHTYSSSTRPPYYTPQTWPALTNKRTVRTGDVPVTFWDVPPGAGTSLLVQHLVTTALSPSPPPSPGGWRPSAPPPWRRRGVVGPARRTPTPGFYGGYPRGFVPQGSGGWCPPGTSRWPAWPPPTPFTTTPSITTARPVTRVSGKVDFEDGEAELGGEPEEEKEVVKVVGKIDLEDFKR